MTRSGFIRSSAVAVAFVLVVALLMWPVPMQADTAQYFYDELGRLVGVVDGQGNVAVYTYDAVGNLISIQRFTSSGGGSTGNIGIFFFTPTSGSVGAQVTIEGFGFSPIASANQVKFNGTSAAVQSATANSISTTVPSGATTGPITVTNTNGTATSPQPFTVLVPPIVSGVSPASVPQGYVIEVQIAGFNLATATAVTFTQSGLAATILSGATSQTLPINLSVSGTVPTGAYPFSVTTPAGTTQSGTVTITVRAAQPSFSVGKLSVLMPVDTRVPATSGPPPGDSFSVAPPLSVSMP